MMRDLESGQTFVEYMAIIIIVVTVLGVILGIALEHLEILAWWNIACLSPIVGVVIAEILVRRHPDNIRNLHKQKERDKDQS